MADIINFPGENEGGEVKIEDIEMISKRTNWLVASLLFPSDPAKLTEMLTQMRITTANDDDKLRKAS